MTAWPRPLPCWYNFLYYLLHPPLKFRYSRSIFNHFRGKTPFQRWYKKTCTRITSWYNSKKNNICFCLPLILVQNFVHCLPFHFWPHHHKSPWIQQKQKIIQKIKHWHGCCSYPKSVKQLLSPFSLKEGRLSRKVDLLFFAQTEQPKKNPSRFLPNQTPSPT